MLLLGDCVADEETGDAKDIKSALGEFGATATSVMGMRDTFIEIWKFKINGSSVLDLLCNSTGRLQAISQTKAHLT